LATIIGGSAAVGMAGLGFTQGLTGSWWLLVGCIGLLILGFFFARKVRSFGIYTLPELVEKQYDAKVGFVASILIVVSWIGVIAGQIVAAGTILSILGMGSLTLWMVIFTLVFVAYTILGGQYSIIHTDTVQTVIIFIGIFGGLGLLFSHTGGLSELKSSLPQNYFSFPLSSSFGLKVLITYLILVGSTYVVGPDMYSRLFCAKDEKTARNSVFWTALFVAIFAFTITLIGMGAKVLYPDISPEQAFPHVIKNVLPPVLNGIVLAALLAAIMSSADTCLLTTSTILSVDVVKRFYPSLSERKTVFLSRWTIVILGILSLGVALALKGVISSLLFAYTVYTCGLVVPVVAGFYKDKLKVTSWGALASIIGGGLVGLLGKIPGLDIPLKGDLPLIGFAFSIVLLFGVSFFTKFR
jgi:SSS family solute:Na+ symporter